MRIRINRIVLVVAEALVRFIGRGTHTACYHDRIGEARQAINEIRNIYYPK